MKTRTLRRKNVSDRKKTAVRRAACASVWAEGLEPRTLLSVNSFDFSRGFTGNGIQFNGGAVYASSAISLADTSTANEARSAFYSTPVAITNFTADFTFQLSGATSGGFTFAMQGVGPSALGARGAGLGYSGISSSAAVAFNFANGSVQTGLSQNGSVSTPTTVSTSSLDVLSGDLITVHVSYAGSSLAVSESDAQSGAAASQTYSVNLASVVGASNGFIGFTAGTSSGGMNLTLDGWDYSDTTGIPGLGVNINTPTDTDSDGLFADAMKTASPWGSVAKPWDASAPVDANGWPTSDAGIVIAVGTETNINGTYALSFTGQASVSGVVCDVAMQNETYNATTNTTTAQLVVTGSTELMLAFTGTRRLPTDTTATGITNVHLYRPTSPGADTSIPPTALFSPGILNELEHFSALRFMNFTQTNNSEDVNWSDRVLPSQSQSGSGGGSWEYAVALCNATNNDLWINVPAAATNAYILDLADLIKYGSDGVNPYTSPQANPVYAPLNPNLHVYIEYSNETWNTLTQASKQNSAGAKAQVAAGGSPLNYDGTTSLFLWQERHNANQTVVISNIFRGVFGDSQMMSRIRPIVAWQYNNAQSTAQIQLDFLNNYYDNADGQQHVANPHPVDYYIWGGSGGWYSWVDGATATGAVTVADSGFESPTISTFQADPTGTGWTFAGTSGIAANGSSLGNPAAADGTQAAYIQGSGSITQTIAFPSGYADLTFSLAQGSSAGENVEVLVNGVQVGNDFTPGASGYTSEVTKAFNGAAPAGTYTVEFIGKGSGTVFIDKVGSQTAADIYSEGTGNVSRNITVEANWSLAYGLHETGYEGGFTFGVAKPDDLQVQANFDSRAQAAELNTLDQFFENGGELGMIYGSAGDTPYGLAIDPSNLTEPKFLGIDDLDASGTPPLIYGTLLPTVPGQTVIAAGPAGDISASTYNQGIYMLRASAPGTYTLTLNGTQTDSTTSEHFMLDGILLPGVTTLPTSAAGTSSPTITFNIPTAGLHALSLFVNGTGQIDLRSAPITITDVLPPLAKPPAVPAAVTGVSATAGSVGEVNLKWLAATGAASYRIERSSSGASYAVVGGAGSSLSFVDTTVSPGVTYFYEVQAINPGGVGTASAPMQVTATSAAALPAPWTDQDINSPDIAGFASYNGTTWTVGGTTGTQSPTTDQLNYLSASIDSTTFSTSVEITSQSDPGGFAGLMARDSTATGAAMASVIYSPNTGVQFFVRVFDAMTYDYSAPIPVSGPIWVRLSRSGNSFNGFYSTDDVHWLQVGATASVTMPTLSLVGLAVSSSNGFIRNIATFSNLSTSTSTSTGATQLAFSQQPAGGNAGAGIGVVKVAVEGSAENVIATDSSTVTLTLHGGTFSTGSATATANAVNGVATFSGLVVNTAGPYTLSAADGALAGANSSSFTVSAAAAAKLVFIQQPTQTTSGANISPAVTVAVKDAYNNTVTTDTSAVTLTLSSNTFSTGKNTATVNAVGGIATFGALAINVVASSYTLTASDASLTTIVSNAFAVTSTTTGTAAKLAFQQQPTATTAGVAISPAVTVAVETSGGSVVSSDTSSVTLTLSGAKFAGGGTTMTVQASGGVAKFSNLVIDAAGSYQMTATDGSLTSSVSSIFQVKAGSASLSQSTVGVANANLTSGATTTVTLTTRDAYGNPLTAGGLKVAFALAGSGTSAGTFGAVTDHGNGTYTSTFTATTGGTARQISASVGSSAVTSTLPTITVTAGDGTITPKGAIFHAIEGRTATAVVATFTVTNTSAPLSHFSATITWGDGTTSAGTIVSNGGGAFTVDGSHAYKALSTGKGFPIEVTIKDSTGPSASIASLGQVIAAALSANAPMTISTPLATGVSNKSIASFNDDNPLATSSNYTGTIAWGDGTQSTAVFDLLSTTSNVKTVWSVVGTHKYAAKGTFTVTITVNEPAANLSLTLKATVDVT